MGKNQVLRHVLVFYCVLGVGVMSNANAAFSHRAGWPFYSAQYNRAAKECEKSLTQVSEQDEATKQLAKSFFEKRGRRPSIVNSIRSVFADRLLEQGLVVGDLFRLISLGLDSNDQRTRSRYFDEAAQFIEQFDASSFFDPNFVPPKEVLPILTANGELTGMGFSKVHGLRRFLEKNGANFFERHNLDTLSVFESEVLSLTQIPGLKNLQLIQNQRQMRENRREARAPQVLLPTHLERLSYLSKENPFDGGVSYAWLGLCIDQLPYLKSLELELAGFPSQEALPFEIFRSIAEKQKLNTVSIKISLDQFTPFASSEFIRRLTGTNFLVGLPELERLEIDFPKELNTWRKERNQLALVELSNRISRLKKLKSISFRNVPAAILRVIPSLSLLESISLETSDVDLDLNLINQIARKSGLRNIKIQIDPLGILRARSELVSALVNGVIDNESVRTVDFGNSDRLNLANTISTHELERLIKSKHIENIRAKVEMTGARNLFSNLKNFGALKNIRIFGIARLETVDVFERYNGSEWMGFPEFSVNNQEYERATRYLVDDFF